ncbi:serine/threonine-protein kinase [Roseiflexus castenholzii]|jgi:serine/threonine-protein kinase|uniref:non-specific serine/threonine protein kinase n=1 Tax=Roseiflexus castenholzii (strain DSM 13941 / HLO8) TaxID=383372 RepID=A7NGR2_ROSCS|nr:serine/threonine-protein kinase [Roseiflexus castenholzii]ABU56655.1 serine/threonine protein kinase with TPR repeats [Roseiflexus castenholzii DSM 13941]
MPEINLIGRTIGRFEILSELGRGGMAVVYKARQTSPNRIVALKVLPPELSLDRTYIARFRQEADSAAALEHPNIVPIYVVDETEGLHYIAMKFIDGRTLKEVIQERGTLPLDETIRLMEQVASALDYAHSRGVIHRDIKPSNMMLDRSGWVYLTDFGLARGTGGGSGLTVTGTVMGTPEYMSPEQAQGLPNVGPPTDIYALGVVIYEMLTGHMPFKADTPLAMLVARLQQAPIPPRDVRSDLPLPVEDVIMRALARKPEARYQSAGELVAALRQAAGLGTGSMRSATPPLSPPVGTPLPYVRTMPTSPPAGTVAPRPQTLPVSPAYGAPAQPPSPPSGVPTIHAAPSESPASGVPTMNVPPGTLPPQQYTTQAPAKPKKGGGMGLIIGGIAALLLLAIGGVFLLRPSDSGGSAQVDAALTQANELFNQRGAFDQAIEAYQQVLNLDATNVDAHTRIALIYQMRSRYTDAEESARAAIAADSRAVLAHAVLAESLHSQGRYNEALDAADEAVAVDPDHPAGYASRAVIKAARALDDADAAMLSEAVDDAEMALDKAAGRENLLQALAHNARGVVYWYQYQFSNDQSMVARGGDEFNRAIGLQGQIAVFHSNLGYFYNDQGANALQRGNRQDAVALLDLARQQFERAQETDPAYGHAHAGLGWNLYYLDDYAGAVAEFDKALSINPQDTDAHLGKSYALLAFSPPDYDGAIATLEQAIAITPYRPDLFARLGWTHMSKGFSLPSGSSEQTSTYQRAEDRFREALDRNDRFVSALTGLGWAQSALGQYEQALDTLQQSLAIKDDQADAHFGVGWTYYNQGRFNDAEVSFRRAIEIAPNDGGNYYWLGLTLEQLGRVEEAKQAYRTAVEKGSRFAQQELDRLGG